MSFLGAVLLIMLATTLQGGSLMTASRITFARSPSLGRSLESVLLLVCALIIVSVLEARAETVHVLMLQVKLHRTS